MCLASKGETMLVKKSNNTRGKDLRENGITFQLCPREIGKGNSDACEMGR